MPPRQLQTFVEGKISVPGLHRWAGAPPELSHLRDYHRHLFVIRFAKAVEHNDRDVEFQQLSHQVRHYLGHQYAPLVTDGYALDGLQFGQSSCEHIATDLLTTFDFTWCSVHEDDENGALILT